MTTAAEICPYCAACSKPTGDAIVHVFSDDHIFPEFFGGKTTIRACKSCNDRFGHTFEGRLCNDIAPFFTMLRLCGIRSTRPFIWKRALKHEGIEYDIDQDLLATPSRPVFQRDDSGEIESVIPPHGKISEQLARRRSTRGRGQVKISKYQCSLSDTRWSWNWEIGQDVRKLALKMCAALSEYVRPRSKPLSRSALACLDDDCTQMPVRLVLQQQHNKLERIRSSGIAHSIFVEADGTTGRAYGVIRFFGMLEFYALLNHEFSGDSFAAYASLDLLTRAETFCPAELLALPEPPAVISRYEYDQGMRTRVQRLTQLMDGLNGTSINFLIEAPSAVQAGHIRWESSTVHFTRGSWIRGTNPSL